MRPSAALCSACLVVCGLAVADAAAGQRVEDAQKLVDHWVESIGGMENYYRIVSARFTVTTEIYDPPSGRLRRTRPRYVTIHRDASGLYSRVERWEGDNFIQQGWHPGGKWAVMNGEELSPGDMDFDQADYVGGDLNYWIFLPFKLNDPGVNLAYDADDGRGFEKVTATFGEGIGTSEDTWRYYFEDGRTWPVEVSYQTERGTRPNPMRWTDIREADGYFYVGRREYLDPERRLRMIVRTHDVSFNPALDLAIFRRP